MGFGKRFKKLKKRAKRTITAAPRAAKSLAKGDFQAAGAALLDQFPGVSDIVNRVAPGLLGDDGKPKAPSVPGAPSLDTETITAQAQEEADAQKRRLRRRSNIFTKPLGVLTSNSVLTRVLTGQ